MKTTKETTIEERAKLGKDFQEKVRRLVRESRLNGVRPTHIVTSYENLENWIDYLIRTQGISPVNDQGPCRIMGMEILTEERAILKL